jgi:hypothetical protein
MLCSIQETKSEAETLETFTPLEDRNNGNSFKHDYQLSGRMFQYLGDSIVQVCGVLHKLDLFLYNQYMSDSPWYLQKM